MAQRTIPRPVNPFLPPELFNPAPIGAQPVPMQQPAMPQAAPPRRVSTSIEPMQGLGPMGAPQAAAASAMPMPGAPQGGGFMATAKGGLNDFLGSDAALAMAAGLLGGGSTSQAIGRGFGNAFQARAAARPTGKELPEAYQIWELAGKPGQFGEWYDQQKKAGAPSVTVNTGEGEKFYDELDKGGAGMFNQLLTDGVMAENKLAQLDRLEGILGSVPTGAEGAMKQIAGEWGINTEGLDDIQAAQAIINQMVPQQRPAGSGPMSDRDVELFKASLPRIINQPGGNQIIIETLRGVNEYTAAQGAIAAAVANREITPQEGRTQLASLPNPLEAVRSGVPQGGGAQRRRYNPQTGRVE